MNITSFLVRDETSVSIVAVQTILAQIFAPHLYWVIYHRAVCLIAVRDACSESFGEVGCICVVKFQVLYWH